jgi:hypothetical protein
MLMPLQLELFCIYHLCDNALYVLDDLHLVLIPCVKKRVSDALRQAIRQNQIFRKFISWKDGTLKLLWMTLKSESQLLRTIYKQ